MSTEVVTVRVAEGAKSRLERFSRFLGKRPSETGAMLLEEGLRRLEHPYIDFRLSGIGRQAFLEGTRLSIWFIYKVAEHYDFDIHATSDHFRLSEAKVNAALHYARSFLEEIQTAIADSQANEESALKGFIPGLVELVEQLQLTDCTNQVYFLKRV